MIQKFFNNLSDKERKLFYVAAVFVVLTLLDRVFFGPVMDRLQTLDKQIEEQKNIIKRDMRFLTYKDYILKESETYQHYFPKKDQTEEEIIAAFLKEIESRASKTGVNIIQVKPSESRHFKGYIEYYANLNAEGKLEDTIAFMHSIDSSPELLKVTKLNMSPKRASATEVVSAMVVKKMIVDASAIEEAKRRIQEGDFEAFGEPMGDSAGGGGFAETQGGSGEDGTGSQRRVSRGMPESESGTETGENIDYSPGQQQGTASQQGKVSKQSFKEGERGAGEGQNAAQPDVPPVKTSVWEKLMKKYVQEEPEEQ